MNVNVLYIRKKYKKKMVMPYIPAIVLHLFYSFFGKELADL